MRAQVRHELPAALLADLLRRRADVRQQHDVLHRERAPPGRCGSFQKTSSAAPAMRFSFERRDQRRFVDDGPARDVHEKPFGTERVEHARIDETPRLGRRADR